MSRQDNEHPSEEPITPGRDIEEDAEAGSGEGTLEGEKARAESYLANWQRCQADFINFKKRTEQERGETVRFANASLMTELLPILDDLERAIENVPAAMKGDPWAEGVELIYQKLIKALEAQGLSRIEAQGQEFDPNYHQAVLHGEGEEGKVAAELQKGYMLHDRLLRPAMVKVGRQAGEAGDE